jgi:alanine racemase
LHLEFNTGMNRLGLRPNEAVAARAILQRTPELRLAGVCTHFFRGEDAGSDSGETQTQVLRFTQALEAFHGLAFHVHAFNSSAAANVAARIRRGAFDPKGALAGLMGRPLGLRPGIALYGGRPAHDEGQTIDLWPVMTLKARVTQLHRLEPGEKVSYGGSWIAKRPTLIGVLPVGYGDGYFRALSNKGSVLVRGWRAPIAGTICMDYLMVDLTDIEIRTGPVALGEEAVLFGRQRASDGRSVDLAVDELASLAGTISYELLTSIGARVPRRFVGPA